MQGRPGETTFKDRPALRTGPRAGLTREAEFDRDLGVEEGGAAVEKAHDGVQGEDRLEQCHCCGVRRSAVCRVPRPSCAVKADRPREAAARPRSPGPLAHRLPETSAAGTPRQRRPVCLRLSAPLFAVARPCTWEICPGTRHIPGFTPAKCFLACFSIYGSPSRDAGSRGLLFPARWWLPRTRQATADLRGRAKPTTRSRSTSARLPPATIGRDGLVRTCSVACKLMNASRGDGARYLRVAVPPLCSAH